MLVVKIPTLKDTTNPKTHPELNTKKLSAQDLRDLHKDDPFMYYSIPVIHKAQLYGKKIDPSNPEDLSWCVRILHQEDGDEDGGDSDARTVQRQERISFESDALSQVMMMMNDDDSFASEDQSESDPFDGLFDALSKAK